LEIDGIKTASYSIANTNGATPDFKVYGISLYDVDPSAISIGLICMAAGSPFKKSCGLRNLFIYFLKVINSLF